jgi:hypothetical protein
MARRRGRTQKKRATSPRIRRRARELAAGADGGAAVWVVQGVGGARAIGNGVVRLVVRRRRCGSLPLLFLSCSLPRWLMDGKLITKTNKLSPSFQLLLIKPNALFTLIRHEGEKNSILPPSTVHIILNLNI